MKVFLESHNLKNPYTGFGQFNYHLLKGFYSCKDPDIRFVVHSPKIDWLKKEFGDFFSYKTYRSHRRYGWGRVRKRYDVWHSLNQNTKVEPAFDLPYVLTIHDVNFVQEISNDPKHPRNLQFEEKLRRADAITYISEFAKQSTHDFFDVPKVPEYVIYNGNPIVERMDTTGFKPDERIDKPFFFGIGNFLERKNYHLLVEMMTYFPDHQLVLAGDDTRPYGNKVRGTIERLGLSDRVLLVGKVDDLGKQYYFEHCEALLFPSLREGFGLPPIEAMAFGRPIFLANTTSLPEIGGEHAFYFQDFDPAQMARDVEEGLNRYSDRPEFYKTALKKQAARFDWTRAAQEYLDVYKTLS